VISDHTGDVSSALPAQHESLGIEDQVTTLMAELGQTNDKISHVT